MNPESAKGSMLPANLLPSKNYLATPLLIYANVLIFVVMIISGVSIISPSSSDLMNWGASNRSEILEGGYWRLIVSTYLHIGVVHLLLNMGCLVYIGKLVEPQIGAARFFILYNCFGIIASVTSIAWHVHAAGAGASGAIMGLFGFYLGLLVFKSIEREKRKEEMGYITLLIVINVAYGIVSNADNAAHLGGAVSGFVLAMLSGSDLVRSEEYRRNYLVPALVTLFTVGITCMGLKMIPDNMKYYQEQMDVFRSREKQALEVYGLFESSTKEDLLYEINERGLYYWDLNMKTIDQLQHLTLPDELQERNQLVKEYLKRRIETYQLLSQGVSEGSTKYEPRIKQLDEEIIRLEKLLTK